MKTLLLLRHAKAENAVGSLPDFDRALSEHGKSGAQAVGVHLKRQDLKLDLVLSSPALRARETAELVLAAAELRSNIIFDQRIYEAGALQLLALLSEIEGVTASLLLVGHNPALADLLQTLTGHPEHMSPGTLAKISLDVEQWSGVGANTGALDWLVNPKQLLADG